ncbi:uncharacterized protein Z519_04319 [Cladophialophora bantiana CBS 173.52]|uniref:SET domain-containing protein n=1 Tax=Cladophialophora bantiana (strain ATCC 10958 / CBS 173.52 / CDC B-1940 / NIH 8579) TaxID=1442370 RepID=A0A0D2IG50_CLAB1|nr:uncharacterized protein Z519_04319 [Cladophialophora bantiana CBS 173.52]KIW95734.1 hypothetical protein Z519_04319 [Cladophialophora bantiana CBS 173.52]
MPIRQTSTPLPKHWPKDIIYIDTLHIPSPLSRELLHSTAPFPPSVSLPIIPLPSPPSPSHLVQIKPINDPTHPAYTQHGLFAARALAPSSFIILYLGTLHSSTTTDPTSNYDLSLDRELDLSIDASKRGNEARFINDYRGIRPEGPNAEFKDCLLEVTKGKKWERRIGVFVLSQGRAKKDGAKRARGIAKGEEIVVSYGKGFWRARLAEETSQSTSNDDVTEDEHG